jgi:hypothetical protein
MELYPYASEDRMAAPHTYMYTPFAGSGFFAAYAASRDIGLGFCAGAVSQTACCLTPQMLALYHDCTVVLQQARAPFVPAHVPALPAACPAVCAPLQEPLRGRFDTVEFLRSLLRCDQDAGKDRLHHWLEWFVHRFEVSKALRVSYCLPGGAADEKAMQAAPYALLAALLARSCGSGTDLKHLNALLKLGDLLCSVTGSVHFSAEDAVLTAFALMVERRVVHDMCAERNIP